MKRWFLFVVFLGISSSMMASYLGTSVPSNSLSCTVLTDNLEHNAIAKSAKKWEIGSRKLENLPTRSRFRLPNSHFQIPKLVVEEVQMEVSREAPVHIYDLSYTVDPVSATFTLTSKNYAIDKLGIKLISQKTGEIKPDVSTVNNKQIQLNLSQVPKGTYYLRLCQKSGDIVKIYRLIKV